MLARLLSLVVLALLVVSCADSVVSEPPPDEAPDGEDEQVDDNPPSVDEPPVVTVSGISILDFGATPNDTSDDDAFAINAALASAQPGDTVRVPVGDYHTRSEIALRPGVRLEGEDQSTSRLIDMAGGDRKLISGFEDHGSTVAQLTLTSTAEPALFFAVFVQHTDRVTVEDVTIDRFQRYGIYAHGVSNAAVERVTISGATDLSAGEGYGVHITEGSHHVLVADSRFTAPLRHAILIQHDAHNNVVRDNAIDGTFRDGIDLHGSGEYDNLIFQNTVTNAQSAGIGVGEEGAPSGRRNRIEDNLLDGNKWGIIIHGPSDGTLVYGNRILNSVDHGLYLKDGRGTRIDGLTVTGTQRFWGLLLASADSTHITQTFVNSNQRGVRVDSGNVALHFDGNDFRFNTNTNFLNLGDGVATNNQF
ncbi:MAG: right-handed parallel beta-helix repeat-containing protein [Bacteroidota bacterium]